MRRLLIYSMLLMTTTVSCSEKDSGNQQSEPEKPGTEQSTPQQRSRIAWDKSTTTEIFATGNYARVIELSNGDLVAVSGGGEGVQFSKSKDGGVSWSSKQIVAPNVMVGNILKVRMSVPEIIECQDGSLLLSYNPRPIEGNNDPQYKYGMRVKISNDNGDSWGDEIKVYDAGHLFENGCWEPFTLQLPSGEIQLYFANESDYTNSTEQNITMCRSLDGGKNWNEGEIVSFRARYRDGMPSALYLEHSGDIIVAIEDSGVPNFPQRMRPMIVRSHDLWNDGNVDANSERREFAMRAEIPKVDNAAAPYIAKAQTDEIILSYQGTEGRDVPLQGDVKSNDETQDMYVSVGDRDGRDFTNVTTPFNLPLGPNPGDRSGYESLWNSVSVQDNGAIWAVASTNYFNYPHSSVYGIKGRLLNNFKPYKQNVVVDGREDFFGDKSAQIVIAHTLPQQLYGHVASIGDNLYLHFVIKSEQGSVERGSVKVEFGDSFTLDIALDEENSVDGVECKTGYDSATNRYCVECKIPFKILKDNNLSGAIPFNVTLSADSKNESIVNTTSDSESWLKLISAI